MNPFWKGNAISQIRVDYSMCDQALNFYYLENDPFDRNKRQFAEPIRMRCYSPNDRIEPFFQVKDGNEGILQGMFDALWQMGIRPTDLGTINSTLAAKDKHLDDLRKIAFKSLNIPNG
jgi:hypothetical protein